MQNILAFLDGVRDLRQAGKVKHKMSEVIAIAFFASLANADDFVEIAVFAAEHEAFLRQYLELPNGIPSHDTIARVFAMVSPEYLGRFQTQWNEMLNTEEGEKIRKLLALDGKTQCGNGSKEQKANHIVSAVDERGFCVGQRLVDEKSNEIMAIPELLDALNVKGHIITIDAIGTQTEIAKRIRKRQADYVLALKGNQTSLHNDVRQYFEDVQLRAGCLYTKTTEKARGGIEIREYWQTDDIAWLPQRKDWAGLKSIAMTRNTIRKNGEERMETRYYISSLPSDVKEIARAIRGHWMVESYHWHLDVTFREDENRTLEKQAAFNLNIIRKWAINILKLLEVGAKPLSLKKKRYAIATNPEKYIVRVLNL
jgi:predicted transposase YbfD/YdcC